LSKIFVDFEFTRMHQSTTAISFGIVTEEGKNHFYAELTDFDQAQRDDWLEANVFILLTMNDKKLGFSNIKNAKRAPKFRRSFFCRKRGSF